ncbi:DNA-processing protein DprA [Persephonella sp.]
MSAIDYIQLSFIKGLGNKTIKHLLNTFGSPENIFQLTFKELSEITGTKTAELILKRDKKLVKKAESELLKAEKLNVDIITYNDPTYPKLLKEIPDPPVYLYKKGKINNSFLISVVGSRKFSIYGKLVTEDFVKFLSKKEITVVSGMALGIDSIAHRTAIESMGYTYGILGSGIDIIYPPENKKLYESVIDNGAVISEFPIGTPPYKYNFPYRNRIIAGISYGTIVTEASEKSGAVVTAKLANDYGRIVFSVPGNINSPLSKGSNNLLKDGAVPLIDKETLIENLPYMINPETEDKKLELTDIEKDILRILSEPQHIDVISDKLNISISDLFTILFDMELKGVLKSENGLYIRLI